MRFGSKFDSSTLSLKHWSFSVIVVTPCYNQKWRLPYPPKKKKHEHKHCMQSCQMCCSDNTELPRSFVFIQLNTDNWNKTGTTEHSRHSKYREMDSQTKTLPTIFIAVKSCEHENFIMLSSKKRRLDLCITDAQLSDSPSRLSFLCSLYTMQKSMFQKKKKASFLISGQKSRWTNKLSWKINKHQETMLLT